MLAGLKHINSCNKYILVLRVYNTLKWLKGSNYMFTMTETLQSGNNSFIFPYRCSENKAAATIDKIPFKEVMLQMGGE